MIAQSTNDLLATTLAGSKADKPTVLIDNKPKQNLIEGMVVRELITQIDWRGTVFEMYDDRWKIHPDPLTFAYCFTVRPGIVKGWGLHEEHEDIYCIIGGEIDLVLYDPRPGSATEGQICRFSMSEYRRCVVTIPRLVWHADHNVGTKDAVVVNFPTKPYRHDAPDKRKLPIGTPLIPYDFGNAIGG